MVDVRKDAQNLKPFPLLPYAALHWIEHARCLSDPNSNIFDLSLAFYADRSSVRDSWWRIYCPSEEGQPPGSFSLLHIASYCGIVPLAERLLRGSWWHNYVKFNAEDKNGRTALHWAARLGNEAMVRPLLEKGADSKAKEKDGKTVLYWAAIRGKEVVVQLLLEKGADPNTKGKNGRTVLHEAASSGNIVVMRLLLEKGVGP